MSVQYQVVWPYATVKVLDAATGQPTFRGFDGGALLPPTVEPADVKRLVGKGAIVALAPAAPAPVESPEPEPAPEPSAFGRPKDYASKQEWVDYAVTRRGDDVSEDDARFSAEGKTKDALITEHG